MEDSLTVRFDEVEQELIKLLSQRADDLQLFSSRQDQLLQSHYHSLMAALETCESQVKQLKSAIPFDLKEINERWTERQNLKRFWVYCEEQQRKALLEIPSESNSFLEHGRPETTGCTGSQENNQVYQTPFQNDSTTNLSTTSVTSLHELSLD